MRVPTHSEARRRVLVEWQAWSARQPGPGPRTHVQATEFYTFLTTDRGALLRSLKTPLDDGTVHGWLFRNGDVLD